jgi:lipid-binding SYLF domain-containing protein
MKHHRFVPVTATLVLMLAPALRAEKATERLREAAVVLEEIMAVGDKGIPADLLDRAHCVVIVPGVKNLALGIGGKYGRGFAVCRQPGHKGWGAPGAVRMEGGSIGWQIGGSESDIIMLVMTEEGARKLMESKFTLDANAEVAAGPIGRTVQASTDAQMRAGILSYSRARGLFAGLSVGGATLRNDLDENKELYGRELTNEQVLSGKVEPPAAAARLIADLNKFSRKETGGEERARKP